MFGFLQPFCSMYIVTKFYFFSPFLANSQHANELPSVLQDLSLAAAERNLHLNTLKMNCFLLLHLVEAFEVETYKAALGNVEPSGKVLEERYFGNSLRVYAPAHSSLLIRARRASPNQMAFCGKMRGRMFCKLLHIYFSWIFVGFGACR